MKGPAMRKKRPRRTLTPQQARIVRELAYTPGAPVKWPILADAIGEPATNKGKSHVQGHVQSVRRKFGRDAILTDYGRGYYLPKDWARR